MSGGSPNTRLPVLTNTATNESFTLNADIRIGRAPDNTIVLTDDGFVSAYHAKVFWDNGWWVEDSGSSNGTFVNEQILNARRQLAPNDQIKIGHTVFRIE